MSVDPHTLAADLDTIVSEWDPDANDYAKLHSARRFCMSMFPLYDAWLKSNPPCSTCDGRGFVIARPSGPDEDYDVGCSACRDRPGVLPFDRWTTGLVALWTADQAARAANPIFGEFDGAR